MNYQRAFGNFQMFLWLLIKDFNWKCPSSYSFKLDFFFVSGMIHEKKSFLESVNICHEIENKQAFKMKVLSNSENVLDNVIIVYGVLLTVQGVFFNMEQTLSISSSQIFSQRYCKNDFRDFLVLQLMIFSDYTNKYL